jgi:hypothetical protein
MKETPILYSGQMVKALLEHRKTMTRRIVKPQPKVEPGQVVYEVCKGSQWWVGTYDGHFSGHSSTRFKCPYGQPGDMLWVRESFYQTDKAYWPDLSSTVIGDKVIYYCVGFDRSTGSLSKRPSIFMPRAACRIFLLIDAIKVERLHDITDEDALAEGVICQDDETPVEAFKRLWIEINGLEDWYSNPWVWCISFSTLSS